MMDENVALFNRSRKSARLKQNQFNSLGNIPVWTVEIQSLILKF